jgi:hypothetical protein
MIAQFQPSAPPQTPETVEQAADSLNTIIARYGEALIEGENGDAEVMEMDAALIALIAAVRAESSPDHICSCGTTMVCPDLGCGRHKSPAPGAVETPREAFIKGYLAGRMDMDTETAEWQHHLRQDAEQEATIRYGSGGSR